MYSALNICDISGAGKKGGKRMTHHQNSSGTKTCEPEWSSPLDISSLENGPVTLSIEADEETRKKIARRTGVRAIGSLCVKYTLNEEKGRALIHVGGDLEAHVVQDCVVTLDPVESDVTDHFDAWFGADPQVIPMARARRDRDSALSHEKEAPMLEEYEDPEFVADGRIDLGELAVQYFSLALDPFPRRSDLPPTPDDENRREETGSRAGTSSVKNPFAALKDWKEQEKL